MAKLFKDIEKDMEEMGEKMRILSEVTEKFNHISKEDILKTYHSIEERYKYLLLSFKLVYFLRWYALISILFCFKISLYG